jgi:hypothetical protein
MIPCHPIWDSSQPNTVHAIEPLWHLFYRRLGKSRSSIRKLSSAMHRWKTFHPQRHDRPPPRRHHHFEAVRCRNTFDSYSILSTITETSRSCRYLPSSCVLINTALAIIVFASRQTRNNVHLTHSPIDLPTFHQLLHQVSVTRVIRRNISDAHATLQLTFLDGIFDQVPEWNRSRNAVETLTHQHHIHHIKTPQIKRKSSFVYVN